MLEDLVNSIREEAAHQRRLTTRRYGAADGSEYIVTLPNWRWRVLDQQRPDDERMKSLLDLVLVTTAIWKRGQPDRRAAELFKACLDDRVDVDADRSRWTRNGGRDGANENLRVPYFVRVYNPAADNKGGLRDYYGLVFVPRAESEAFRRN